MASTPAAAALPFLGSEAVPAAVTALRLVVIPVGETTGESYAGAYNAT